MTISHCCFSDQLKISLLVFRFLTRAKLHIQQKIKANCLSRTIFYKVSSITFMNFLSKLVRGFPIYLIQIFENCSSQINWEKLALLRYSRLFVLNEVTLYLISPKPVFVNIWFAFIENKNTLLNRLEWEICHLFGQSDILDTPEHLLQCSCEKVGIQTGRCWKSSSSSRHWTCRHQGIHTHLMSVQHGVESSRCTRLLESNPQSCLK